MNCGYQTNRFERAICAADCSTWCGNRMNMGPASRCKIERSVELRQEEMSLAFAGSATTSCPEKLFGSYMQFSVRSYNLKEGRERAGHVGVRAPNEHCLYFGKLGVQFMHRDPAVPPSRGNYTFGQ